jgi:peptidyl-prolyl cis-trans isomerase SurA
MRIKLPIIVFTLLMLAVIRPLFAADVIDRIVATVNGHIILQSDWDDAIAYEAFINGKPLQQSSAEDRKAVLDRLVDQELLRQQIPANDPQYELDQQTVNARLEEVRKQTSDVDSDQSWHALLARYNLSEDTLKSHVVMQLRILRLIDERLTSTVQVDDKNIEDYYNQTFIPQLRQKGAKEPPLVEVTPKIRELLTQQKLNDALKEWLQNLHDSSVIVLKTEGSSPK